MTTFKELVAHVPCTTVLVDQPSGIYVESLSASGIHQLRKSVNDVPGIPFTVEELDTALANGSINQLLSPSGGFLRQLGLIDIGN